MAKPNPVREVLLRAQALDRRRQAQIANQVASINRLLERFGQAASENLINPHAPIPTSHAVYDEEMKILHEGAAALKAENDELAQRDAELVHALCEMVNAVQAVDLIGVLENPRLKTALEQAKTIIAANGSVSESGGEAG